MFASSSASLPLSNVVAALSLSVKKDPPTSIQSLVTKINEAQHLPYWESLLIRINSLIRDLTLFQFSHPARFVIELVSNSLDSLARKGKVNPIKILISKNYLKIKDQAEGLDYEAIPNLLVPGRSSNSGLLANETFLEGATGRFGQGFNSIYVNLLDNESLYGVHLPTFNITEEKIQLVFPLQIDEKNYLLQSIWKQHELSCTLDPFSELDRLKQIKILSRKEEKNLEMTFCQNDSTICVNFADPTKVLKKEGTSIEIFSPFVSFYQERIIREIEQTFSYVSSPSIFLNNTLVNSSKADAKVYSDHNVDLFYSSDFTHQGQVWICENGKKIYGYETQGFFPQSIVISFKRLPLTQDREVLNISNKQIQELFIQTTQSIILANQLNWQQKAHFFNAFHPIFSQIPSLMKMIKESISKIDTDYDIFFPLINSGNFKALNKIPLHPDYFYNIEKGKSLYFRSSFKAWVVAATDDSPPFGILDYEGKTHLFIDESVLPERQEVLVWNLSVLSKVLSLTEENDFGITDYLKTIKNRHSLSQTVPSSKQLLSKEQENSYSVIRDEELLDLINSKKFIFDTDSLRRLLSAQTFPKCYAQFIIDSHTDSPLFCLNSSSNIHFRSFFISFLYHRTVEELISNNKQKELENIFRLITETIEILKKLDTDLEKESYGIFIKISYEYLTGLAPLFVPETLMPYNMLFEKLLKIRHATGCSVLAFHLFFKNLDEFRMDPRLINYELMEKLVLRIPLSIRDKMWAFFPILKDLEYLNELSETHLRDLIDLIPENFPNLKLNLQKNDYEGVVQLLALNERDKDIRRMQKLRLSFTVYTYLLYFNRALSQLLPEASARMEAIVGLIPNFESSHKERAFFKSLSNAINEVGRFLSQFKICVDSAILFKKINAKKPPSNELEALTKSNIFSYLSKYGLNEMTCLVLKYIAAQGDTDEIRNILITAIEKTNLLTEQMRPFIYLSVIGNSCAFGHSTLFPKIYSPIVPLHEDPDVLKWISREDALRNIQKAFTQNNQELVSLSEAIKNALEAGSKKISLKLHRGELEKEIAVYIEDDGEGMNIEDFAYFKTPNISKKKKQGLANYGWGIFTYFEFKTFYVESSKGEGEPLIRAIFTKNENEITVQTELLSESTFKGTKLILKKNIDNELVESIKIHSYIMSACKEVKGCEIALNSLKINAYNEMALVEYKEPFFKGGLQQGHISFQIKSGEGGIYRKGLKVESFDQEHLKLVPKILLKLLAQSNMGIFIFLPDSVDQNMNRNKLVQISELNYQIKRGILLASLKGALHLFINGYGWKEISSDYWDEFTYLPELSNTIKLAITSIQPLLEDGSKLPFNDDSKVAKEAILNFCLNFCKKLALEHTISFPDAAQLDISSFIEAIRRKEITDSFSHFLELLAQQLNNDALFFSFFLHLKFSSHLPSFMEIRDLVCQKLQERKILKDNQFNNQLIEALSLKQLLLLVENIFIQLKQQHPLLEGILVHFQFCIKSSIEAKKNQQAYKPEIIYSDSKKVSAFFKDLFKSFWGKDIHVEFYEKNDGALAYTHPGSNTLYLNLKEFPIDAFLNLCQKGSSQSLETSELNNLIKWVETAAHEKVHMDENSSCEGTHDPQFNSKIANSLSLLIAHSKRPFIFDYSRY